MAGWWVNQGEVIRDGVTIGWKGHHGGGCGHFYINSHSRLEYCKSFLTRVLSTFQAIYLVSKAAIKPNSRPW